MDSITFSKYEQERRSNLPPNHFTVPDIRYMHNLEERLKQMQLKYEVANLRLKAVLEELAFIKSDVEDFINSDRKDDILTATVKMLETILKENTL